MVDATTLEHRKLAPAMRVGTRHCPKRLLDGPLERDRRRAASLGPATSPPKGLRARWQSGSSLRVVSPRRSACSVACWSRPGEGSARARSLGVRDTEVIGKGLPRFGPPGPRPREAARAPWAPGTVGFSKRWEGQVDLCGEYIGKLRGTRHTGGRQITPAEGAAFGSACGPADRSVARGSRLRSRGRCRGVRSGR